MKKLVIEDEGEGLIALLGEKVLICCCKYFYTGILDGVDVRCVKLKNSSIVYSTGDWSDESYSDIQKLHTDEWYIQIESIESFGLSK